MHNIISLIKKKKYPDKKWLLAFIGSIYINNRILAGNLYKTNSSKRVRKKFYAWNPEMKMRNKSKENPECPIHIFKCSNSKKAFPDTSGKFRNKQVHDHSASRKKPTP